METFRIYILGSSIETQANVKKALKLFRIGGFQLESQTYNSAIDLIGDLQVPDDTPCMVVMSYIRMKKDGLQLSWLSQLNCKGVLILNSELRDPPWEDSALQKQLDNLLRGYCINYLNIGGSGFTADRIKQALLSLMPWPIGHAQ